MSAGRIRSLLLLFALCLPWPPAYAGIIRNNEFRFTVEIPDHLVEIRDTSANAAGNLYFDTVAGVVMMISERQSKFKNVADYIDCASDELEQKVRTNFGDSDLRLLSCRKPELYPEKVRVLHFRVSMLPMGYNSYMVYFIHHRDKDIQFSFTYKETAEKASIEYINAVMTSLHLK